MKRTVVLLTALAVAALPAAASAAPDHPAVDAKKIRPVPAGVTPQILPLVVRAP